MNYFWTSDTHYGHENIIKYSNRPFKSLQDMNEQIIKRHNERVKPGDIVFHLGDFCFRNSPGGKPGEGARKKANYYLSRLNGTIIILQGNHDKQNSTKSIIKSAIIEHGKKKIFMTHRPKDFNSDFEINLVGHIHEKWKVKEIDNTLLINVGVDVWNFYPITFNNIMSEYMKWKNKKRII